MSSRAEKKRLWRKHQKKLGIVKKPKVKLGSIHDKLVKSSQSH